MNQQRKNNSHEIENYSWGVLQDMIEREVNAAFKIRPPMKEMPSKKEIKKIVKQSVCRKYKVKKLGKNEATGLLR